MNKQSSDTSWTGFRRDCLAAVQSVESLSAGASADAVKRWLDDTAQYDDVSHDRLSRTLDALVDGGYVEKGVSRRRACTYRTTAAVDGELALAETEAGGEKSAVADD